MKNIEWKPIPGFDDYLASSNGLIKSNKPKHKGALMAQMDNQQGYKRLRLCIDGIKYGMNVHRLIALAFIPNPKRLKYVNHKDGDKENNNVLNLEWTTSGDNQRHAYRLGLRKKIRPNAKINEEIATSIRRNISVPTTLLMVEFNLSRSAINRIKNGSTWHSTHSI